MKFTKEKINECAQWVRVNGLVDFGGATKASFCKAMGISADTLNKWERKTEFAEAIKKAKDEFKGNLEFELVESLAKSAKGYRYKKKKTEYGDKDGKLFIKKETTEDVEVQPNVGAAIFLLTNLCPERWKNRQTQDVKADVSANVDADVNLEYDVKDIPDDLLFKTADILQQKQYEREKADKERKANRNGNKTNETEDGTR